MIENSSVLALIPARGGSKGIPRKNIVPFMGKPLIAWTIKAARESKYIDRVVLSSDDQAICEIATNEGCEVPFLRPAHLANDASSSMDVVFDALERLPRFDFIVLLQPTSPLRVSNDVDGCLEKLMKSSAPSCVAVTDVKEHPFLVYKKNNSERLKPYCDAHTKEYLRRQDLPDAFKLNGAVYAAKVEWLKENGTFLSDETVGFHMPLNRSVDIDTLEDLELAERMPS